MEKIPKDSKRGTIYPFFSSQMTKKKKCDSSSTSNELLVTQAV